MVYTTPGSCPNQGKGVELFISPHLSVTGSGPLQPWVLAGKVVSCSQASDDGPQVLAVGSASLVLSWSCVSTDCKGILGALGRALTIETE